MEIKALTKDDYEKIASLFDEYWNERKLHFTRKQLSNYIRNPSNKIFALREEDIIMGLLNLSYENLDLVEIKDLIIKREFRGNAYGAKLLEHAIEYCKDNNVRKLFVLTNPNLRDAYVNYGFALEGYLKNHLADSEDLILMSLFLNTEKQIDLGKKLEDIKVIEDIERKTSEGLKRVAGRR